MTIPQIVETLCRIRNKFKKNNHHIELRISSDGVYQIVAIIEDSEEVILSYRQIQDETLESFLSAVMLSAEHNNNKKDD